MTLSMISRMRLLVFMEKLFLHVADAEAQNSY